MKPLTRSLARLERSVSFRLEMLTALALCRVCGICWAIRYLRNPNPRVSEYVLRHFGAEIGAGTTFKRTLFFDNVYEDKNSSGDLSRLCVGKNCYIGDGVYFDLANRVVIHDNVIVAGRTSFITHTNCNRSKTLSELFPRQCQTVEVDHDVWIGFGATILAGVKIGAHCVVAAGAVVTGNLAGGAVYAGTPARLMRTLDLPTGNRLSAG